MAEALLSSDGATPSTL